MAFSVRTRRTLCTSERITGNPLKANRKRRKAQATLPRGSIYTTIMELGPQNHNGDGLLGLDPLGYRVYPWTLDPKSSSLNPQRFRV